MTNKELFVNLWAQKLSNAIHRNPSDYGILDITSMSVDYPHNLALRMSTAMQAKGARSVYLSPTLKAVLRQLDKPVNYTGLQQVVDSFDQEVN